MDHESYNRLAARVLIVEEENKRLRRLIINNFASSARSAWRPMSS